MRETKIRIAEDGSIVIPDEYLQALNKQPGDELIMTLEDDEIHLFTIKQALKRAQNLVGRYSSPERSLADELIAERKLEVEQ